MRLSITINFTDNISQLGDYDLTHGSCDISLFKFKSFDQFNTPQTASNFRHVRSCGTIGENRETPNFFSLGFLVAKLRLLKYFTEAAWEAKIWKKWNFSAILFVN